MRIIAVLTAGLSLTSAFALPVADSRTLLHKDRTSEKQSRLLKRVRGNTAADQRRPGGTRNFIPAQRPANSPRGNARTVYQSVESATRTPPPTVGQIFLAQKPHDSERGTLPRTQVYIDRGNRQFTIYLADDNANAAENVLHGNAVMRHLRIPLGQDQYLPISGDQDEWLDQGILGGSEVATADFFVVDAIPEAERRRILTVASMIQGPRRAYAELSNYPIRFVPFHGARPEGWKPFMAPYTPGFPVPLHEVSRQQGDPGSWGSVLGRGPQGSGDTGYGSARYPPPPGQYPGYPQNLPLPADLRPSYGDYQGTNVLYASPAPGAVLYTTEDMRGERSGAPSPPNNLPNYNRGYRRDVITDISKSETAPNATQQRIEDLEDILWALQEFRADATEHMTPVINNLVNGTNNTLVNMMALSIYAMVHPGVSVLGPFVNGMSSLASLMGNTTMQNSATSTFVSIMNRKYADAWGNATAAANATGLLTQIAVLENALDVAANETHLLPVEWTTVQEDPNLSFFTENSDPHSPFGAYGYWFEYYPNNSTTHNSSSVNSTGARA